MERLTERHVKKSDGYYMKCSEHCENDTLQCDECDELDGLVERLGSIEDILGDNYDLDHLREMVEADQGGRCVVLPISTPSMAYTVDPKGGYISSGFYRTPGAVLHDIERGYVIVKTREEAEAALKGERHAANV